MNLQEILELDLKGLNILIAGTPATGKSHLCVLLEKQTGLPVIHTDDYKHIEFKEQLYTLIRDLQGRQPGLIVEGVLSYRLIRKWSQGECAWVPDIVIECVAPDHKVEEVYITERGADKLKTMRSFVAGLRKIRSDYKLSEPDSAPRWVEYENTYGNA